MDLLDFTDCQLYFEEPLSPQVEELIASASDQYGTPEAEHALLLAHLLAPEHLAVLVALYRYYFYQHRLAETLAVAERTLTLSARRLELPEDWHRLDEHRLAVAASLSFGLLRFHLLALKASSVVLLRMGRIPEARERLRLLNTLDAPNQLGVTQLLEVVDQYESELPPPTPAL